MKMKQFLELNSLSRSTSTSSTTKMLHSSITNTAIVIVPPNIPSSTTSSPHKSTLLHSFFQFLLHRRTWFSNILPTTNTLSLTLRRKLTGTLFGHRHGHVTLSLQLDPRAEPLTLLHLDISITALLKEMSSGLLRIALESRKLPALSARSARTKKLLKLPTWTMYCNGRETGLALSRTCEPYDRHLLNTIRTLSVGAGVIPILHDGCKGAAGSAGLGELVYMRAEFERVVGSADSEALFMINPDGNAATELSIFLLRI